MCRIKCIATWGYMVPASRQFLAYVILPVWLRPLSLLSRGGGGIQVHPTGFALGRVQIYKQVAIEKPALTIWSRQRTYVQPTVLQEGVHTICHCA